MRRKCELSEREPPPEVKDRVRSENVVHCFEPIVDCDAVSAEFGSDATPTWIRSEIKASRFRDAKKISGDEPSPKTLIKDVGAISGDELSPKALNQEAEVISSGETSCKALVQEERLSEGVGLEPLKTKNLTSEELLISELWDRFTLDDCSTDGKADTWERFSELRGVIRRTDVGLVVSIIMTGCNENLWEGRPIMQ